MHAPLRRRDRIAPSVQRRDYFCAHADTDAAGRVTDTVRVFVNAAPVDVARGATALDCVRSWRGEEADDVAAGRRLITDSRGLPIDAATPATAGSIYRTIANRRRDDGA